MKLSVVKLLGIFSVLALAGCAHHRDVRPSADGKHLVRTASSTEESAQQSALRQAEHYCSGSGKSYAIVSEKTSYTGTMDENTRKTIAQASKVAGVLGHLNSQPGTSHRNPMTQAGIVGQSVTDGNDYITEMRFICR